MPADLAGTGTVVAAEAGAGADLGSVGDGGTPEATPGTGTEGGEGGAGEPGAGGTGEEAPAGEGEPELPAEGEEEPTEADGRKVDAKTREALAALKKINPAAAKSLLDNHFRTQAIIKDVGAANLSEAVNKVRQMAATVESLGGEQGITDLQTEISDYRAEIQQFSEGDPALLEQLHTANPDSFATAMTNGLELIATKAPDLIDRVLMPTMVARLEKAGMYDTIKALAAFIKEGKGQEAYDLTTQISTWLDKAKGMVSKQLEMKSAKNPEKEALDAREAGIAAKEKSAYEGSVATDVNRQNNTATSRVVEPFFKQMKLNPEGRHEFINALNSRIFAAMKVDAAFQRAAKAIMGKGDAARASKFVHAKFAELLPDHFRKLRNAMYPNIGNGTKAAPAAGKPAGKKEGAAAPPPKITAGKTYKRAEVDINATPQVYLIIGKAYLKGTKTPVPYER